MNIYRRMMSLGENELVVLEYTWKIKTSAHLTTEITSNFIKLNGQNAFRCAIDTATNSIQLEIPRRHHLPINVHSVFCTVNNQIHQLDAANVQGSCQSFRTCPLESWLPYNRPLTLRYRILVSDYPTDSYRYQLIDNLVGQQLWTAARNRRDTNVVFVVGQHTFGAHQLVLALRSSFWNHQFDSLDIRGEPAEFQIDTDPETFGHVLHFIYTGQLKTAPDDKLMKLAEKYQLEALMSICQRCASPPLQDIRDQIKETR